MRTTGNFGLLLGLSLLSACASGSRVTQLPDRIPVGTGSPAIPGKNALAGTDWRLVEFQSMDDSQGATRPANRDSYTMRLGRDGTAAFQLDCNRATGSWSATESADGSSGTILFGAAAVTSALCPPPSMGEALARDLPRMRGFLLKEGRLFISLMADGGVYVWEPLARQ